MSDTGIRTRNFATPARKTLRWGGILHPLRFLRSTGHLPYHPVSYTAFDPQPLPEVKRFEAPEPARGVAATPWLRSPAVETTMAHSIAVPGGVADCLGYVFDRRGRLVDGGTHKHREGRKYRPWRKRARLLREHSARPRLEHVGANVAVLTSSTQSVYFHWLFEILPRLALVPTLSDEVDLFYIEKKHRFQEETLEFLGVSDDRIINAGDVPLVAADRLVVPCHQIMRGREFQPWAIRVVRDRLLPAAGDGARHPRRPRIYVTRSGSQHRRVQNEDDILGKLQGYGFVEVSTEAMSFPEQVRLFQGAEIVIAPHGSGLANLVFSSPGTRVIELFPAANIDLYYRLSTALGLSYSYVKARSGDPQSLTMGDYPIAWGDLERILDLVVKPLHLGSLQT